MLRFRQMKALQKFASVHASVHNLFNHERDLVNRQTYRARRAVALAEWQLLAAQTISKAGSKSQSEASYD
jgi:putative transposase